MGRPPCRWDGEAFANRGDVTFGTAPLAHRDPGYLHLAAAVHVPSAAAIDAAIAGNAGLKMLGPYGAGDAQVESVRCRKTVYAPASPAPKGPSIFVPASPAMAVSMAAALGTCTAAARCR